MSDGTRSARGSGDVDQGGRRALLLVFAGLAFAIALLPFGILGLALEVAAIVVGVRAMRRARASGKRAPGALAAVIAGSAATVVLLALLAFVVVFYDEYRDYQNCLGRALTESARTECRATFEDEVDIRGRLGGGT